MSNKTKKRIENKIAEAFDIESHIISCDASYRGGTLKVDVSELFPNITKDEAIMGASQNYLGGGMRACITGGAMFSPDELSAKEQKIFFALKERIKQYFHAITNDENLDMNDEWNTMSYDKNQAMPVSGY